MNGFDLDRAVHRRHNPLSGDWVLVSPHRTSRPWQGQSDPVPAPATAPYDPQCYLCPGNRRANGALNPPYASTYVFDNDFPALTWPPTSASAREAASAGGLLEARAEAGLCRVVCYSPRHDLSLGQMPASAIRAVIDTWGAQYLELGSIGDLRAVTVFENRGALMGASNPHPHGQIWASETIPPELEREDRQLKAWQAQHRACLLCAYERLERERRERLVIERAHWIALVPFWAVWPFETLVLPRAHVESLDRVDAPARDDLAALLRELTHRYDTLFGVPFPYTMGIHQRPTDGEARPWWHLHLHFYPPLLRSATVRKFMVGYELLAGPQRDITPERAARRLRELPIPAA